MSTLTDERRTTLARAETLVGKAMAEHRELTAAERSEVETALARVETIDRNATSSSLVKQVLALGTSTTLDPEATPGSLFDEPTRAGFLTAIKSKTAYRATVPRDGMQTKAGPILGGSLLPTAGNGIAPALYPNAVPSLADLMPTVAVAGPTVRYYRIGAGTAAVVPEGGAKPDSGIGATAVDVTLAKIAATLKVSDELTEDAPWLLGALQAALVNAVLSKENEEVVATLAGTSGILAKTGATADLIDLVAQAIAGMQAVGTNPNAVLVNPATLATIRQAKASTSQPLAVTKITMA